MSGRHCVHDDVINIHFIDGNVSSQSKASGVLTVPDVLQFNISTEYTCMLNK